MSVCVRIKGKKRKLCSGDLDRTIEISARILQPNIYKTISYDHTFTLKHTVWAMVETTRGTQFFDGVNVITPISHHFYIRYIAGIDSVDWIKLNDDLYDIVDIENLDERNEYLKISANKRGSQTLKSSEAGI